MDGTRWVARTSFASALLSALGATTCCTLPTVLGALGLGGAVASAATAIPALTFLGAHRVWLFVVTGVLLTFSWAAMAPTFLAAANRGADMVRREHSWENVAAMVTRVLSVVTDPL